MMVARVASALFAFAPFGFALIRAVGTEGRDLRYLWVAIAAFIGAMARMALAARRGGRLMTPLTLAAGVFFMSTVAASVAAIMLGTSVNLAVFIVAAGFGFCFAASTFLRMQPR